METMVALEPKVQSTKLHGGGTWLAIEVQDVSVWAGTTLYEHRVGNFGTVEFRHIDKEFVQGLYNKLGELLTTWKISS